MQNFKSDTLHPFFPPIYFKRRKEEDSGVIDTDVLGQYLTRSKVEYRMSIIEAVKGAHADISSLARPADKLARLGTYIRVLGAELMGMATVIPYGVRAFVLHHSLPSSSSSSFTSPLGRHHPTLVSLTRAIPYGPDPRNAIDIYLPCDHDSSDKSDDMHRVKWPVMLFVHGGVWAAGERFHYSPMAVRCAQAGIVTAVMSYTLYPQAKVPTMVDEVGSALDWTLENISLYGGDPSRVVLVGHSAGAQLSALSLLQRSLSHPTKSRMPCAFVGMAGVYNISEHFRYEQGTGSPRACLHFLSKTLMFKYSIFTLIVFPPCCSASCPQTFDDGTCGGGA